MTWHKRYIGVILVLATLLLAWIFRVSLLGFARWLFGPQTGPIVVGFISGLLASLLATLLYSFVQKEAWQEDIRQLKGEINTLQAGNEQHRGVDQVASTTEEIHTACDAIKSDLSNQLAALRRDHDGLLERLVPAIGGPFTESLFAFPPMASEQIARILSVETRRLYRRHHKRVIVTKAKDTYAIKALKRLVPGSKIVWSLEFHIMWEWWNDSKVVKHPLDDFLLVAVANEGALPAFTYQNEADKVAQHKRLAEFFEDRENIVRSIIVNPFDDTQRIPDDLISELFTIDRINVSCDKETRLIRPSDLRKIPEAELPIGVYSAFSLPPLNLPLPVGARLGVEYIGRMCRSAETGVAGKYRGFLAFPPSDVIGSQYDLTLLYPASVELEGKEVKLDVVAEESGCQFVHEPLANRPSERTQRPTDVPSGLPYSKGGRVAQIQVTEPLTELHRLLLTWKGDVSE